MALSNRDRVNAGFEILAEALNDFLTRTVQVDSQSSWIDLLEMVDAQKGRRNEYYSPTDPQASLRFITEGITGKVRQGWYPLNKCLGRADEALASELRQTRNDWAHNKAFTPDDTYRALDTMERLVRATGNREAAKRLAERKTGARVVQERKASVQREQNSQFSVTGENLPPWRELVTPHPDVADGTFNPSGFAADLHTVANAEQALAPDQVSASAEYTDPQQFFDRTYLTQGLKDLLSRALRRTAGDLTASPIINLQTNFGGGKTHSMLAVWHLFGGLDTSRLPQDMLDLLHEEQIQKALQTTGGRIPAGVRRVALVGTSMSASGNMTMPDGTTVQTIWGYLAWQLGGKAGYEIIREDDLNGTNPGAKLRVLLERFGPAVILIDEWVAYARQLVGEHQRAGGSLSTQQSFAQALGEAVAATPQSMLLVSIPASAEMEPGTYVDSQMIDEEIGGADGREALQALMQVINRQAEQWRPAGAAESFEIVRRRIFQDFPDDVQGKIENVAEVMRRFYDKNSGNFPHEAARSDYKTKIIRCYPIHPELFDRLYGDWAVLPKFQRTRGVLRLMSIIVHNVWRSSNSDPFIMPASVPVGAAAVANELTQYLDDGWKSVVSVDVDGPIPRNIDLEHPLFGARHVAARLSRTVFLGSAPRSRNSGLEERYVNLGTALPGDKLGNFPSALNTLSNRSAHFYEGEGRYWFDTSTNITSVVREREEGFALDDLYAEIEGRLQKEFREWSRRSSSPVKVLIAPQASSDVPDLEDVRLVVLPPAKTVSSTGSSDSADQYVVDTTSNVGLQSRTYKNTLVYLAADGRRLPELVDGVRKYLAWKSVQDSATELDLTASQSKQTIQNTEKWDETVNDRINDSYQWVLVPTSPSEEEIRQRIFVGVDKHRVSSGQQLFPRTLEKLASVPELESSQAARVLALNINTYLSQKWEESGFISFGSLWDMHTRYLYMPRLTHRKVLEEGIRHAHFRETLDENFYFALADGVDESVVPVRFLGLRWPDEYSTLPDRALPDSLLLVHPEAAQAQFERETEDSPANSDQLGDGGGSSGSVGPAPGIGSTGAGDNGAGGKVEATRTVTTYYGTFTLPLSTAPSLFMRIDDEILFHYKQLAAQGAAVELTLDVKVTYPEGIPDSVRKMTQDSTDEILGSSAEFE